MKVLKKNKLSLALSILLNENPGCNFIKIYLLNFINGLNLSQIMQIILSL